MEKVQYWTTEISKNTIRPCETLTSYNIDKNRTWTSSSYERCWVVDEPICSIPNDCVDVKDKVVLDLGCGFVGVTVALGNSTPERFIELGASKVIGVDLTKKDVDRIADKLGSKFIGICEKVDTIEKLQRIIDQYNPTIIKSDIEGDEVIFLDLNFDNIDECYIECHSMVIFNQMVDKLKQSNYRIREVLCYNPTGGWYDFPERVRIIYAQKNPTV